METKRDEVAEYRAQKAKDDTLAKIKKSIGPLTETIHLPHGLEAAEIRYGEIRFEENGRVVPYLIIPERKRDPEAFRADLGQLFAWLEQGRIAPVVAERIALDEVARVHGQLETGGLQGKVVVEPWR